MKLFIQLLFFQSFPISAATIQSVQYSGVGCAENTVEVNISKDSDAVTIAYSEFLAEVHEEKKREKIDCTISLTLDIPAGKSLGFFNLTNRGFMSADENTVLRINSQYYLAEHKKPRWRKIANQKSFGPIEEGFHIHSALDLKKSKLGTCQQPAQIHLDIQTTLTVKSRSGYEGFLTVDASDGELYQEFGLSYTDCNRPQFGVTCTFDKHVFKPRFGYQPKLFEKTIFAKAKTPKKAETKAYRKAWRRCTKGLPYWSTDWYDCNIVCAEAIELTQEDEELTFATDPQVDDNELNDANEAWAPLSSYSVRSIQAHAQDRPSEF